MKSEKNFRSETDREKKAHVSTETEKEMEKAAFAPAEEFSSEKMKEGKAEKKEEIDYEELINERIAKAVLSRPVLHMDYDEFDAWLRDGQKKYLAKRRRRRIRLCSIVVCAFVCVSAVTLLPPMVGESSAARDNTMTVTEEGGNVIIGGDGEAGFGTRVEIHKSFDDLSLEDQEGLILFNKIPESFSLNSIRLEKKYDIKEITINYFSETLGEELVIHESEYNNENEQTILLKDYKKWCEEGNRIVYRRTEKDVNYFAFIENEKFIKIISKNIQDKEIEAMIDSLYQVKTD